MTNSNGQGGSALLSLVERKRLARAAARARLAQCDPAVGEAVGKQILAHLALPHPRTIAGFCPLGRELDLTALLRRLRDGGHTVALPRTPPLGSPLAFHRWADGDELLPERFGTLTASGPEVQPDLLLVPLLAFDRRGHRLGYGGAPYARTIAARPGGGTAGGP